MEMWTHRKNLGTKLLGISHLTHQPEVQSPLVMCYAFFRIWGAKQLGYDSPK